MRRMVPMIKPKIPGLFVITIVFTAFTLGFFLGRYNHTEEITVSVPERFMTIPAAQTEPEPEISKSTAVISFPISLNDAEMEELLAIPGIGTVLAERILSYRSENGPFSSPEELLNVDGIGKKRLDDMIDFITIGG